MSQAGKNLSMPWLSVVTAWCCSPFTQCHLARSTNTSLPTPGNEYKSYKLVKQLKLVNSHYTVLLFQTQFHFFTPSLHMAPYSTYGSIKRKLLDERGATDQLLAVPTPPAVCVQPCVQLWHSEAMLAQADWPWLHSGWGCFLVTILYPTLARF